MTPAVRFFLSRALTPHVQAGSRWTAINALNRRAFVVGGKDAGSPFLRWLAEGRPASSSEFEGAAAQLGVDTRVDGVDGFLTWYRQLNFDYPFLDYAGEDGRRVDARLMNAYSASAPEDPEPAQPATHPLPADGVDMGQTPHEPSEALLAAWLRVAIGYKEISPGRRGPVRHRTSPSGGARHPTEIGVALHTGWGALAGQWRYDSVSHGLERGRVPYLPCEGAPPNCVVFSLISRVTRAMWRYRDVRAFRPVLYDAGHIVETLVTVLQLTGWSSRWVPAPAFLEDGDGNDISIGYVIAGEHESVGEHAVAAGHGPEHPNRRGHPSETFRTNPFVSLAFEDGQLVATNHLEPECQLAVTGSIVDALAYSTPSSRNDRPTDSISLEGATALTREHLDLLRQSGLLLDQAYGDELWRKLVPWSKHDWYLSAIVHAEAAGCERRSARIGAPVEPAVTGGPLLIAALDHRRTARSFRDASLPAGVVDRALRVLEDQSDITVVLSTTTAMDGLPQGVHVITPAGLQSLRSEAFSDDEISRAAIGQPWARGFACAIWLLPIFPSGTAAEWEAQMVLCGRLAQRLTLAVSHEPSVGVFQSPAMIDAELSALLPDHAKLDGAYLVGIGVSDGRDAASRERVFQVRDVLRPSS